MTSFKEFMLSDINVHEIHILLLFPDTIDLRRCGDSHNSLSPSCPQGGRITIIDSNYGRTVKDPEVCPYAEGKHKNEIKCDKFKDKYTRIAEAKCNGEATCSLIKKSFGDPCRGTYKYFEVRFNCTSKYFSLAVQIVMFNVFCLLFTDYVDYPLKM